MLFTITLVILYIVVRNLDFFKEHKEVCFSIVIIAYFIYHIFIKWNNTESINIDLPGNKKQFNIFNYFIVIVGIYSIFNDDLNNSIPSWSFKNFLVYLIIALLISIFLYLYVDDSFEKRVVIIKNDRLYFQESTATYAAPIKEFQKIKISYNKISAIAKDGRRDRLGGYKMTDGDILNLIAFLREHTPDIELDVRYEKID
ncbi:hypothetical protein [Nonlabens dokdonensis]|uniref:Uncharacterized protein n=2 Tax=Nonlabens dokdonensis TaxID=328515 RepID=L7WC89_NONDD|nr:hypothetical protein [Nonlabens dokdonensis]AGC77551.1 hypothetical protein DDD_2424 [Nonlabens dokdonensis DSW-6]